MFIKPFPRDSPGEFTLVSNEFVPREFRQMSHSNALIPITGSRRRFRRTHQGTQSRAISRIARQVVNKTLRHRSETKWYDARVAQDTVGVAGKIYSLTDLDQGDDINDRVGNRVHIMSLQGRFEFTNVDTPSNTLRVIIFQWLLNDATAPVQDDILQDAGGGQYSPLAPYTHNSAGFKFIPLYDKLITCSTAGPTTKVFQCLITSKDFKRKATPTISYNSDTVDTGVGNLWILMVSDSVASTDPTLSWWTRFRFQDS